jgi:hypothetical protein
MTVARYIWAGMFVAVAIYTSTTISSHGVDFFSPFFGALGTGDWQGQFNADFLTMLTLSAWWTGWRNAWSVSGLVLATLAFLLGAPFLCLYLIYLSSRSGATPATVLLGARQQGNPL